MEGFEVVICMKKSMFAFSSLFLLATLASIQKVDIPAVRASPDIYQGDLILTDNNVTVIEGRFDINGSIIVEENATLIMRNALINFTETEDLQFNITFRNPTNGNPHLFVENSMITSNSYALNMWLHGNSSTEINNLTAPTVWPLAYGYSIVAMSNSTIWGIDIEENSVMNISDSFTLEGISIYGNSSLNLLNCTLSWLEAYESASVYCSSSTINEYISLFSRSINCSIEGLEPCLVSNWNFKLNCSVEVSPSGWSPEISLVDTEVGGWSFDLKKFSNATISKCELKQISIWSQTTVFVYDSLVTVSAWGIDDTSMYIYDSTII